MFFVEGDMEREAFRQHFGIKAKRIGINGDRVALDSIARNISTDIAIAGNVTDVFVMFDREGRTDETGKIQEDLEAILCNKHKAVRFKIVVPDRDTECWLFADVESVGKYFGKKIGPRAKFEGKKGADEIKRHIGPGVYEKMIDGVRIFAKARWSKIVEKSQSAQQSSLHTYFSGCEWFRR
jgi:hypothetical protein